MNKFESSRFERELKNLGCSENYNGTSSESGLGNEG